SNGWWPRRHHLALWTESTGGYMTIRWLISACLISLLCASAVPLTAQTGAKSGEWRTYGADLGSTHYSPLDQINASNFNKLEMAWHFKTDNPGARHEFQYDTTPVMTTCI